MSDIVIIKIGAIKKINFILNNHQRLINMCKITDVIKHSLHKDIIMVRHILQNGKEIEERGK